MEHQIPAQKLHLMFRADIDGEWHPSPYPKPTVAHWSADKEQALPMWRNSWIKEGVHMMTEIPDFMGKVGKTVFLERYLESETSIKMTVNVKEGDNVVVGPCYSWLKKVSEKGPQPVAWLRKNGKSLKTAEERKAVLQQLRLLVTENIDAITKVHDMDRVFPARFNGVAMMLTHGIDDYLGLVDSWTTPEKIEDACPPPLKAGVEAEHTIVNEAKGVCINVSPWNAPVQLSLIPVMAMIAAGNHAVIKPPELVPNISALLRRLVTKYLHGYVWVEEGGPEAVNALIDEGADHLCFTGGGSIAKVVAARCAQQLTPCTLELGGKSPVFVDKGLPKDMLEASVREILETKVHKTGQFCCSHDYALVHEEIHEQFLATFKAGLEAVGDKRNVHLIGRRQYESLKAKWEATKGECFPPMAPFALDDEKMSFPMSALLGPPADSEFLQGEIFGPVMPVVKVKDIDEAISYVQGMPTGKPLIAYCYSADDANINSFIERTSSGNVAVNSGPQRLLSNTNVGFGGIGNSGIGASMWGRDALREFSNRKHVIRPKVADQFAKSYFSGPPPAP